MRFDTENLTVNNFYIYAAKAYENLQCIDETEFNDDLKRIKYLKRLFNRYAQFDDLKERLILNHIIIFYNVFEHTAATKLLFFQIDNKYWSYLKTFLIFLGYMPDIVRNVREMNIISSNISIDTNIAEKLRKI